MPPKHVETILPIDYDTIASTEKRWSPVLLFCTGAAAVFIIPIFALYKFFVKVAVVAIDPDPVYRSALLASGLTKSDCEIPNCVEQTESVVAHSV